jgi:thioredoxin-like negative regulator of GroEL
MSSANQCILVKNNQDYGIVLQSEERIIALIYASWCPFCIRFLPVFEHACAGYTGGKYKFFLFQDDQEIMTDEYMVEVVPTVLFFKNGALVKRLDGTLGVGLDEKQLSDFIQSCEPE